MIELWQVVSIDKEAAGDSPRKYLDLTHTACNLEASQRKEDSQIPESNFDNWPFASSFSRHLLSLLRTFLMILVARRKQSKLTSWELLSSLRVHGGV